MHAHYLASLAFVIFVALIVADTTATDPRLPRSDHSKRNKSQLANETGISILKRGEDANMGPAEERLGELSVSVLEKLKSLFTPATATSKMMNRWAKNKKSAEAAFARLRLDRGANPILQPQFSNWVEHVDEMNVPGESVIETLTKIYGDDKVFSMINKAKLDSRMQNYAITLEADQMKRWVAIRKDPDEIFRLFNLHVTMRHIFETPEFSTWAKYVEDVSARHPEQPSLMYTTLTKYYYDDALLSLANAAKRSENTMPMANKVIDDWFHAGIQTHKTPYQAFRDLGLGKSTDTLMRQLWKENSLENTWVQYMDFYNRKYPHEKTSMIETFTKAFGDIDVTIMLHSAKREAMTRHLATTLESGQLDMWLSSGKSTDDVFKLLKLDTGAEHSPLKPLLNTWVSYLNLFIAKNPSKKNQLFSAMKTHVNEEQLNDILNIAKKFPALESTATKVQVDMIPT